MQSENQIHAVSRKDRIFQKKAQASELLVLAAYGIFILKFFADISPQINFPSMMDNVLIASIAGLLAIKLILQRYNILRFILTVAASGVLFVSSVISANYLYMFCMMFVISFQDVDLRKLLLLGCSMKIALITFHVVWYIIVYITDPDSIQYVYRGGSTEPRHFFFLGHANMFTAIVTWVFFELIYLYYRKINAIHLSGVWIVSLTFYFFTDSNTGILVLFLITALIAADKLGGNVSDRAIFLISRYGHMAFSIVFPLMAVVFTQLSGGLREMWLTVNAAFSQRLWYGAYTYNVAGATLFGRLLRLPPKVFWGGRWFDTFVIFDNYYLGMFLSYGTVQLIAISLAFILIMPKLDNRDKIMVISYALYGAMEAYVTNVTICFALLLIGKALYKKPDPPIRSGKDTPLAPVPLWKR